ncbi:MAG: M61 family metallopeptidase [Steroidobacteraceae bacterium]
MPERIPVWTLIALLLVPATGLAAADPRVIPAPRDVPYAPGTLTLHVDATDLDHRVFRVHETIPVSAGSLVLFYPKWLPGNHAPTGPIALMQGLVITADSRSLAWHRDPVDMYAFHVDVPRGARRIELEFQFTSPVNERQGRMTMTPDLLGVQWEKMLLYPAGYYAARIPVEATLRLPSGWAYGTALEGASRDGDEIRFRPTSLETLVDSPLFAGRHAKRLALDTRADSPVWLNVFGDRAALIDISEAQLAAHRNLVAESDALFGARHYAHYDFLLAVSDNFATVGLEHHQSSENGVPAGYFTDWDDLGEYRDLLAHELTHSWNGKFRRPADLWTPNYNVPMRDDLLWVYEGQTEFWALVLAARSGLWAPEFAREALARYAAEFQFQRPGRIWRSLADTTSQPIIDYAGEPPFESWARDVDYYTEGLLIWLDVDTQLRALTGERRSLDDFACAFCGMENGRIAPLTYTLDDVIATLNGIAAHDWRAFFAVRLEGHGPGAPLDGIARAGWRLTFSDEPNAYLAGNETRKKQLNLGDSAGLIVSTEDAAVAGVVWGSAAFRAGIVAGNKLIAVNGREFSADLLKEAIREAAGRSAPIELLVKNYDVYRTVKLDWQGGLRYPHLERIGGTPDRLSALFALRRTAGR